MYAMKSDDTSIYEQNVQWNLIQWNIHMNHSNQYVNSKTQYLEKKKKQKVTFKLTKKVEPLSNAYSI